MKIFLLICLASGLASSEKLDRSYLPPPGSKFSGGRPGDIEVPFEFPKETYSTGRPPLVDGKPDIELGINRRPVSATGAPANRKPGFTNFQNSVPTTTTSYAITQTTTFAPADDYDGLDQPIGFINGSNRIQPNFPGQTYQQQPIGGPGQGPSFQYQSGQGQPSTVTPYGTTSRPAFSGTFKGLAYLPPAPTSGNSGQSSQSSVHDSFGYSSGQPQGPKYQDGGLPISDFTNNQPGYVSPGSQQNQLFSNQNIPSSTATPQYQGGRFGSTGKGFQQNQNQIQGTQFPLSTAAPQYQNGQRLPSPGSNQQNQFLGSQNIPSSTAAPAYQNLQQFSTPGLNQQQFESREPNQQIQYSGNQNFPSSTSAPTPGLIQSSQFPGNLNFPSTAVPSYQNGQRFPTPGQIQGEILPDEQSFGSDLPIQNQYTGNQNFPSTTATPQFQDGERISTPGYAQEGYRYQVPSRQNQNQYSGNQIFPSSTTVPQYQNNQQFTTSGSIGQNQYSENQNIPSTAAPVYQNDQVLTTPGQSQGGRVSDQQSFGSRIPSQQSQNQYTGDQNFPSSPQYQANQRFTASGKQIFPSSTSTPTLSSNFPSTAAPNYKIGQRFTNPSQIQKGFNAEQERFGSRLPSQQNQNQYTVNQNFPSSTTSPQYQAGQRFTTPEKLYPGSQSVPSSTTAPQYQDQRFSTPGQQVSLPNQPSYPGSTTAPQYQQTFGSTPGINSQGFIQNQPNQNQRPTYNQQIPSSTTAPVRLIPESQSYGNDGIQTTPGTAVSFAEQQGALTGGQTTPTYLGNSQQPTSQTGSGLPVYGTTPSVPSRVSNQRFPSTTAGSLPARDFSLAPGNFVAGRPERPQAEGDRNAEIINFENVLTPEGYYYSYDTSNGIHADETGTVGNGTRAQGGYSYTGDDGKVYSVFYSADENGFLPRGDHLPTPPPIPEAIQRVIDQASKDKESGIEDDGSYNEEKYGYMKYEGPFTQLRPQNKAVSIINGADISNKTNSRIGGPNKNIMKLKGNKVTSENYPETNSDVELETEPEFGKIETDEEENRGDDYNSNKNKEPNSRVSTKRPKPNKNMTAKDSRPNKLKGNKIHMKPTIGSMADSLQKSKTFEINGSSRRPTSPEEMEASEYVSDSDISQEEEDKDNLGESQDNDFDYDPINYKDDPNNRTDFHGSNKYLPKPKGANRKNQSSKKRPTEYIESTRQPLAGATKTERPGNRYSQTPEEIESDDNARARIPSRKNQFGLKIKDLSNTNARPVTYDSDDEKNTYNDSDARFDDENDFDDKNKPKSSDRMGKPRTSQSNKQKSGKPERPSVNERKGNLDSQDTKLSSDKETAYEPTAFSDDEVGINEKYNSDDSTKQAAADRMDTRRISQSNRKPSGKLTRPTINEGTVTPNKKNVKLSSDEETGYEYTPPQRKFESEGAIKFPSKTFQKESQTTLRPFMTKNVYGDENEPTDEGVDQYDVVKPDRPGRPMSTQTQQYPGFEQENPHADINEKDRFSSTRKPSYGQTSSRRPFGRPQTTTFPQYEGPRETEKERYYEPVRNQGSQRPGDKLYYNTNDPSQGTSETDGNVYSSTTPLPGSVSNRKYRPGQYEDKPTDGSVYYDKTTSPGGEIPINIPGYKQSISGQVPSTTYRPNYSFGDRTSAPNSPITVDGFGRPIGGTNAPAFDGTIRPTYSTVRPSIDEDFGRPSQSNDNSSPTVGRFGVTSTQGPRYQSSTSAPIGEDFSGPKQLQRFDPDSGYYYK